MFSKFSLDWGSPVEPGMMEFDIYGDDRFFIPYLVMNVLKVENLKIVNNLNYFCSLLKKKIIYYD